VDPERSELGIFWLQLSDPDPGNHVLILAQIQPL
jgi:hypothetical protein